MIPLREQTVVVLDSYRKLRTQIEKPPEELDENMYDTIEETEEETVVVSQNEDGEWDVNDLIDIEED